MKHLFLPMQLTCLSLAISAQLYAQDIQQNTSAIAQLETIVTTASRSAQSISDIAGTVYSIPHEEIVKQVSAGKSTADILGVLVPSLTASTGTTTNYGMTMRGRVVQYMIDGVPQTGSRDGSRQLNSIQPLMIERIEVISGASSIYGSGASGGIINIITKKDIEKPLSFSTTVGISSQDKIRKDGLAYEVAQSAAFKHNQFSGSLSAGFTQRGEIQNSFGQRIGPEIAQTDRQDTKTLELNGRLNWNISDEQNISVGTQYFKDKQDSDYGPDYGQYGPYNLASLLFSQKPSLKAIKGLNLDTQPKTERWQINTQYHHDQIFADQSINVEAYYRKEKGWWFPTVSPLGNDYLNGALAQLYPNYANPYSPDFLKAIAQGYAVVQSESDIDVWGTRVALQKDFNISNQLFTLIYGVDYEQEKDKASATRFEFDSFYQSNGLNYKPINRYQFGPDVKVKTLGLYLQGQYELTDRINLQAGIRQERIDSNVSDSTPYREAIPADILQSLGVGYSAKQLVGGSIKHNATLFNVGAVYHLNNQQQIFANFSQGFSLPDVQRMLRDVPATFIVTSNNIDPIKVNNYELGWRIQGEDSLKGGVTVFYNDSDKVVKFNGAPAYNIEIIDTDERVYGVEANAQYSMMTDWNIGGTLAYTRGQFKNSQNKWQELDAIRIAPLKATLFSEWMFNHDAGIRVQALIVGGTDKARQEYLDVGTNDPRKAPAEIKGFATMDVIGHFKVGPGVINLGIYNMWNRDYKTVFSQAAATTYGQISSLAAQGRSYGLSYTMTY